MKKETMMKTRRLLLQPMSPEALEAKIRTLTDPELKKAYGEMLSGCKEKPEDFLWYTPWQMIRKTDGKALGDLGFKGAPRKGTVEIGYGIEKDFEGQGYTTEALGAMLDWAFAQDNVYAVEAETEPDNAASRHILEKFRFLPAGEGAEGPRFRREKPQTSWMAVYMCFGASIGCAMGSLMENIGAGMCYGMAMAMCLGAAMDASQRKRRKAVLEEEL